MCLMPALLIAVLLLLGRSNQVRADLAANTLKTPKIAPPGGTAYGKTLGEWLGTYWRWYYSGANPDQSKVGPVQLLPLPAADYISGTGAPDDPALYCGHLELTLPAGTPFVLPLFAWIGERYQGYPAVADDIPIDNAAFLAAVRPNLVIDGRTVITTANDAAFYVPPTPFDPIVTYATPTSYGSVAAIFFQSVGIVSAPLSPGVHEIHLYEPFILPAGAYPLIPSGLGTIYDNTWIITVR